MDTTAVSYNQNQLWNENHLDMMGLDALDLAGLEENLRVFSHCNFNEHSFSALTNMGDDVRSSSICNTDFTGSREPSAGVSNGFILKKGDADNLLDAMVSYMCDASGDIASVRSNSIRSPTSSSGRCFLPNAEVNRMRSELWTNQVGYDPEINSYPKWPVSQPYSHMLPSVIAPRTSVGSMKEDVRVQFGMLYVLKADDIAIF
ncbi:hypothetical protein IFM89_003641 [Coptis chinensis]|uniref:Uncharacterized protein n=1 Tax=Coptis chinensis TaxID=261450 RepID=A0A835ME12_9MAGN|nr:hypothetical protein IFM89_003641 [Coptis chinensis]